MSTRPECVDEEWVVLPEASADFNRVVVKDSPAHKHGLFEHEQEKLSYEIRTYSDYEKKCIEFGGDSSKGVVIGASEWLTLSDEHAHLIANLPKMLAILYEVQIYNAAGLNLPASFESRVLALLHTIENPE